MMKTQRVSTNLTFFWKIAFPLLWLVFFGSFALAVWLSGETNYGTFSADSLKFVMPLFFIIGFAFLYWTTMRLKRVEMDEHFVYVTNYFKNFRYPYHNIDRIIEKDYGLFKTVHIYFKEKGTFGKKIAFVASRARLQTFLNANPRVVEQLIR